MKLRRFLLAIVLFWTLASVPPIASGVPAMWSVTSQAQAIQVAQVRRPLVRPRFVIGVLVGVLIAGILLRRRRAR
jgi:hypothetical protein